jgi:ATP/maltotriose-dependent transcriptional regulator MalT
VHELLRQYAWDKLEESQNLDDIRQRHSVYFTDFLFSRHHDLYGGRQREATTEIAAELENIRAAWHTALDYQMLDNIQKAGFTFQTFYQFQSRYLEGADEFEKAVKTLESEEPDQQVSTTLSELLVGLGWLKIRLGQFDEAERAFKKSLKIVEDGDLHRREGGFNNPWMGLGVLANIRGDYAQAEKIARKALPQIVTEDNKPKAMDSFYVLTNATYAQGRYEEARGYGREAYTLADEIGDQWMKSYILNDLGDIDRVLGDFDQARRNYQRSYEIRKAFDDSEGMAVALNALGDVAMSEQRYGDAEEMYGRSRAIYQEIGDRGGLARALDGLGNAAVGKGDRSAAQAYYSEALAISEKIHFVPLILTIMTDAATWLAKVDRAEDGTELLALVLNHPAASHDTRVRAERSMVKASRQLSPDLFTSAQERGRARDLEEATSSLLKIMKRPRSWSGVQGEPEPAGTSNTDQLLLEPLTARELEVLHLMARGWTNPEIAEELTIAVGTVKSYTAQIYGKLGVNNRVKAVTRAREIGLI